MGLSNLERYLNDHLTGAAGALTLVEDLMKREELTDDRVFFEDLYDKIQADRDLLEDLMIKAELSRDGLMQAAGGLTAKIGRLKLLWEGLNPGDLGLFEALEMLALGIQGKRLLWRALKEASQVCPQWEGVDFESLAAAAKVQRDGVEQKRLLTARVALRK